MFSFIARFDSLTLFKRTVDLYSLKQQFIKLENKSSSKIFNKKDITRHHGSLPGQPRLHRAALRVCSCQKQELKKHVQNKALRSLKPAKQQEIFSKTSKISLEGSIPIQVDIPYISKPALEYWVNALLLCNEISY